jgi:hypothetical protein
MKWIIAFVISLLLAGGSSFSYAATATLVWDAPTNKIANNSCAETGDTLTPEEADMLEYTVSYRVQGSGDPWINVETTETMLVVTGLLYDTIYEAVVGSHWPGILAMCATDVLEFSIPAPVLSLVAEAESGVFTGAFVAVNDPNASGGQYVHVPDGSYPRQTSPPEAHKVELSFEVEEASNYRIKGLVDTMDSSGDSFWIRVDGEPSNGYEWFASGSTAYTEDYVNDHQDGTDPVIVYLEAGVKYGWSTRSSRPI